MEEEFNQYEGSFTVNFDKVSKSAGLLSITRMLALQMINTPYSRVGDFLKDISDIDLKTLVDIVEHKTEDKSFENIMLISEMLSLGEGLDCANFETFTQRTNQMSVFIICESLARKGMVKVCYENMSFGDDMRDAIVVEKI